MADLHTREIFEEKENRINNARATRTTPAGSKKL